MTLSDPLLSVIVPIKNGEKFITQCFDSIKIGGVDNFEIIFINDYSSDDTLKVLHQLKDPRIIVINNVAHPGISSSLNQGLSRAQGKFLSRMDIDDLCFPNRFKHQIESIIKDPSIDFVGGGMIQFTDISNPNTFRYLPAPTNVEGSLLYSSTFYHPTILFKRSLFDQGLFRYNEKNTLNEDQELWIKIFQNYKMINLQIPLIYYRKHELQATQQNKIKRRRARLALNRKYVWDSSKNDKFFVFRYFYEFLILLHNHVHFIYLLFINYFKIFSKSEK